MKIQDMKAIQENRENLLAFLHISEIQLINANLTDGVDVNHMTFDAICNVTLEQYQAKKISNKQASTVFDILSNANTQLKTERYRYNAATHEIYEYSLTHQGYIFYQKGGQRQLNALIAKNGKYI